MEKTRPFTIGDVTEIERVKRGEVPSFRNFREAYFGDVDLTVKSESEPKWKQKVRGRQERREKEKQRLGKRDRGGEPKDSERGDEDGEEGAAGERADAQQQYHEDDDEQHQAEQEEIMKKSKTD